MTCFYDQRSDPIFRGRAVGIMYSRSMVIAIQKGDSHPMSIDSVKINPSDKFNGDLKQTNKKAN